MGRECSHAEADLSYSLPSDFLLEYNETPQTPPEQIEFVDMLRIIKNGGKIGMVLMDHKTLSVDTPYDFERIIKAMANDK
jgi:CMP-2-keto-3-deoxyoctulosonic acid synthetase